MSSTRLKPRDRSKRMALISGLHLELDCLRGIVLLPGKRDREGGVGCAVARDLAGRALRQPGLSIGETLLPQPNVVIGHVLGGAGDRGAAVVVVGAVVIRPEVT